MLHILTITALWFLYAVIALVAVVVAVIVGAIAWAAANYAWTAVTDPERLDREEQAYKKSQGRRELRVDRHHLP